jgi:hypothetical protein
MTTNIQGLLMDMLTLSQIQVFKKHHVGIQTQELIKVAIAKEFVKEVSESVCILCRKKLTKPRSQKRKLKM